MAARSASVMGRGRAAVFLDWAAPSEWKCDFVVVAAMARGLCAQRGTRTRREVVELLAMVCLGGGRGEFDLGRVCPSTGKIEIEMERPRSRLSAIGLAAK